MLVLMDNGSLEPAAVLALRGLAARVAERLGRPVAPVSLLHSSGVDPAALDGVPAEILEPFLEKHLGEGVSEFRIVPLFFGPSAAFTEYLPKRIAALTKRHPGLRVTIAPCLCDDAEGEGAVAGMLERAVRAALPSAGTSRPPVILVDHGSPLPGVTAVRDRLAGLLRERLGAAVSGVLAASMERRDGPEYAFNEPLLETALRTPGYDSGPVIVAFQFLFPGRHAGPGGDIARICAGTEAERPGLRCVPTSLVGADPALIDLACRRVAG